MVTTVVSLIIATSAVVGTIMAGCVAFAIIMFLSDDGRKPRLALFSRNITIFLVPLGIVFVFLTIMWAARILTA